MEASWVWAGFLGLPIFMLLASFLIRIKNPSSIVSGFFFNCFIVFAVLAFLLLAINLKNETLNPILSVTLMLAGMFVLFVLLFGHYLLIGFLFINAALVFKKERRSLANSLTFFLALALIIFMVFSAVVFNRQSPEWLKVVWAGLIAVIACYFLHVCNFLSSLFLACMWPVRRNKDYVIVLGSGLIKGKVSPLLGARIDKAIAFYNRQKIKRKPPKLIFSGGKGADEPVSEAEAMRDYALEKGFLQEDILVEKEAKNTKENMILSKKIIDADSRGHSYKCAYSTSSYHLLRAAAYARKAGLPAPGLRAKTAAYYLPNAILREYIALILMHKKRNIIIAALAFLLGVGAYFAPTIVDFLLEYFKARRQ